MKKQIILLPALLIGLNTACSSKNSADVVNYLLEQETKNAQAQTNKGHRHSLPEGIISVDIVASNDRLHLLTGHHYQGHKTLWHQFSDDEGNSWSSAVKILGKRNLPVNMERGKDAQITAQGGNIVVTWMQYVEGVRFNAGPMMAARSSDGGQTWQTAPAPPDWEQGPHGYFDLAADSHAMHAVWLDSRNGRPEVTASQALYYARSEDGGLSWQNDLLLDGLTCSCCWNTVKTDAENNAFVLYRDKQPSDMSIGRVDPQQQWQRLNHVGAFNWQFEGCPHIGGGLDFQYQAGQKRIHAVIGSGHPDHLGVHYLSSDDNGKNWSETLQLGDESAVHADIASHPDGRVVAVFDMMGEDGLVVFSAQSADKGNHWSQPEQISTPGKRASHPRIVKTKTGFLVLWTENDGHQQTLATRRL